mmetsp:Transcript_111937/g.289252  ORF Transcript_111937/g.289252 Transcript_111937/m.289252 type:complete len:398 (-) Transcript_111937:62-1255(-)
MAIAIAPEGSLRRSAEILRARLELHEIVAERLEARASCTDSGLARAMAALRATSQPLVQEALSLAAEAAEAQQQQQQQQPQQQQQLQQQQQSEGAASSRGHRREPEKDKPGRKQMSREELLELIEEVYACRAEAEASQPGVPDTLERHLYAHLAAEDANGGSASAEALNVRAQAVFEAIQRHAGSCCEVAVFAKILQHRLPEASATTLIAQRDAVASELRRVLDENYQNRQPREREALWRVWLRSGVPLAACDRVAHQLYAAPDANRLMEHMQRRAVSGGSGGRDAVQQLEVSFEDFEQSVLFFQVELTERFLGDFARKFSELDVKGSGVLDPRGLAQLAMGVAAEDGDDTDGIAAALMSRAASEGHGGGAAFSRCVEVFSPALARRWDARRTQGCY